MRVFRKIVFVCALCAAGAAAAGEPGSAARARVSMSMGAAVQSSPASAAARSGVEGDAAGALRTGAPGSPWVEWQREGVGPSLKHRLNSQTTVRAGTPFVAPWSWGGRSRLRSAVSGWRAAAIRTVELEAAAEAGERWLQLGAAVERRAITKSRVSRLDKAVALQRKRLEFGEISGMELSQIELEQARWSARLLAANQEVAVARELLEELCGDRCRLPQLGDLAELVAVTRTPERGVVRARLEVAPMWRTADEQARLEQARWKVAGQAAPGLPEIEAEWERVPALEGLPAYDALGVRLRVPLMPGSEARAARAEAEFRAREARDRLRAVRERLRRTLNGRLEQAEASMKRLAALEDVLGREVRTELALAEQFRLGAASYLVYIDGLGRLDDVRLEAVEARFALLQARLELATMFADREIFPLPAAATGGEE